MKLLSGPLERTAANIDQNGAIFDLPKGIFDTAPPGT